jgi:hypothetical protein
MLQSLLELLWSWLMRLFAPILGPFTRAASVRRVDDGSMV